MEPMSRIVIFCNLSAFEVKNSALEHTLSSASMAISAWLRDMTGLSNHALSAAPRSPLLTLFEALPMGIIGRSGLRVIIRSAGETLLVKALRVILTVLSQYFGSSVALSDSGKK